MSPKLLVSKNLLIALIQHIFKSNCSIKNLLSMCMLELILLIFVTTYQVERTGTFRTMLQKKSLALRSEVTCPEAHG